MGTNRTRVDALLRKLGTAVTRISLDHAVRSGIPWPKPRCYPEPLRALMARGKRGAMSPINPSLALALLDLAALRDGPPPSVERLMYFYSKEHAPYLLSARLEEAAKKRGLSGAGIVAEVAAERRRKGAEGWIEPCEDLEFTMIVLAKSGEHVFLASKSPLVNRIRMDLTIDLVLGVDGVLP